MPKAKGFSVVRGPADTVLVASREGNRGIAPITPVRRWRRRVAALALTFTCREPMLNAGVTVSRTMKDGWTVKPRRRSNLLSTNAIVVTENGCEILTLRKMTPSGGVTRRIMFLPDSVRFASYQASLQITVLKIIRVASRRQGVILRGVHKYA